MDGNDNKNKLKTEQESHFFLPDFCHTRSVFVVVLVSELLAIILTLMQFQEAQFWQQLGRYSITIQWIALLSTALLCLSKPFLRKLSDLRAGLISYSMVLVVTLVVTLSTIFLENWIKGNSQYHIFDSPGLYSNLLVAAILAAIMLRFFYLQAQYRKRVEMLAVAKLEALQARIQPHFLFNSMNIIAGLIHEDPEKAEQVIEDLSDLFRASLAEHRSMVSLQSEIELCKRYIGIEQLRLGDRLDSCWEIDNKIENINIPPLTLQPLIENAIYHGIQPRVEGGIIKISIKTANQSCLITIENPLPEKPKTSENGNHLAVDNIQQRLKMLYENQAKLNLDINQQRCKVTLTLPITGIEDENISG